MLTGRNVGGGCATYPDSNAGNGVTYSIGWRAKHWKLCVFERNV